jgi:serine/threonine-protein kinase RsbW
MTLNTMTLIKAATLETTTDLEAMTTVTEWFNQFLQSPLPHQMWMEAQVALLEGFTNVVLHAHRQLQPDTPIELKAQLFASYFQLCIWDMGNPYDFEATLAQLKLLTENPTFIPQDREAHWGSILLLRLREQAGWQITYTQQPDSRNCLQIEKAF